MNGIMQLWKCTKNLYACAKTLEKPMDKYVEG